MELDHVKDVSYLTTMLKLARRKGETEAKDAIVKRLKDIGLLKDEGAGEGRPYDNLRTSVNHILQEEH